VSDWARVMSFIYFFLVTDGLTLLEIVLETSGSEQRQPLGYSLVIAAGLC